MVFGGLAQLGERLAGSQKVIGSSPLSSSGVKPCISSSYARLLFYLYRSKHSAQRLGETMSNKGQYSEEAHSGDVIRESGQIEQFFGGHANRPNIWWNTTKLMCLSEPAAVSNTDTFQKVREYAFSSSRTRSFYRLEHSNWQDVI